MTDDQSLDKREHSARGPFFPLVLLPLLMVLAFVLVIVLFGWLGLAGDSPEELITRLQRADRGSFRDAVTLVQLLREPGSESLRRDERLGRQLSRLLHQELAAGQMEPERIRLRSFLCRALGELERAEVLEGLLAAADTERDLREIDVRRSALEAIAQFVARHPAKVQPSDDRLLDTLLAATRRSAADDPASAERDALRATAAFALGVLDDPRAHAGLVALLDDPRADVRFNAATGLARWGRAESVPVLLEMLDPESESVVRSETTPRQRAWRRQIVLRSALRSVELLCSGEYPPDGPSLVAAVQRLSDYPDDLNVQHQALRTMQALKAPPQPEGSGFDD
jgi:HEAT repeat protein